MSKYPVCRMCPPLSHFKIGKRGDIFQFGWKIRYLRNQYISEMSVLLLLNRAFDKKKYELLFLCLFIVIFSV